MRKSEQRVWDAMKRSAPPDFWLERIENMVSEGLPDVLCSYVDGCFGFVELKAAKLPAKETTRVLGSDGLRVSQISWHRKAAAMKLHSFILIRDDANNLYLLASSHAEFANDMTKAELTAASLASSWPSIFNQLRHIV